jgi:hypothetical protein
MDAPRWWVDWPPAEVFLRAIPDFVSVELYHQSPSSLVRFDGDQGSGVVAGADREARLEDGRIVAIQLTAMSGAWLDGRLEELRAQRGGQIPHPRDAGTMVTGTSPACRVVIEDTPPSAKAAVNVVDGPWRYFLTFATRDGGPLPGGLTFERLAGLGRELFAESDS